MSTSLVIGVYAVKTQNCKCYFFNLTYIWFHSQGQICKSVCSQCPLQSCRICACLESMFGRLSEIWVVWLHLHQPYPVSLCLSGTMHPGLWGRFRSNPVKEMSLFTERTLNTVLYHTGIQFKLRSVMKMILDHLIARTV